MTGISQPICNSLYLAKGIKKTKMNKFHYMSSGIIIDISMLELAVSVSENLAYIPFFFFGTSLFIYIFNLCQPEVFSQLGVLKQHDDKTRL